MDEYLAPVDEFALAIRRDILVGLGGARTGRAEPPTLPQVAIAMMSSRG